MGNIINSISTTINKYERKRSTKGKYKFENRSNDEEVLCYILAGYKEYLWEAVFERLERAAGEINIDVCIVSSGKYCAELSEICKKNSWSYLSTYKNNICLAQNIVLELFSTVKWIFKLDEDMFLPQNYFSRMIETYNWAKRGDYKIGVLAPLIPINSYGTTKVLEILDLKKIYNKKFGDSSYGWSTEKPFYKDSNVAKFFWGEGGIFPELDILDKHLEKQNLECEACSVLFNIGAIMFTMEFWKEIGPFNLGYCNKTGMGRDEKIINQICNFISRPIMVSQNIVVGHFAFTPQNEEMKRYFYNNKEKFLKRDI